MVKLDKVKKCFGNILKGGEMVIILILCVLILLALGIAENIINQRYVNSFKIRVNVNGIRGKSTVTRLITSVIAEAGYKTMGKTTGTEARIIYPEENDEEPIKRRMEGANISEQLRTIKKAAKYGAEALVCECMAVNPDYQSVFQRKMIQANIGVIVNVLEDHLDVMGPTLDQIAEAFTETIPYNGYLITIDGPYVDYYKNIAKSRNTKVIVADNSKISEEYLSQFDYVVFPDNASLALAVGEAIGIDTEVALKGMLKANPDPGALKTTEFWNNETSNVFVNGFAANDAASTLKIWERICNLGYSTENTILVINCRDDRVDRTEQFAKDVLPYIKAMTVVAIGKSTGPISKAYKEGKIDAEKYLNLEELNVEKVMDKMKPIMVNSIVFGMGNIHGEGEPFIEELMRMKSDTYQKEKIQNVTDEINTKNNNLDEEQEVALEVWDEEFIFSSLKNAE